LSGFWRTIQAKFRLYRTDDDGKTGGSGFSEISKEGREVRDQQECGNTTTCLPEVPHTESSGIRYKVANKVSDQHGKVDEIYNEL
jgi:hypothetical protein